MMEFLQAYQDSLGSEGMLNTLSHLYGPGDLSWQSQRLAGLLKQQRQHFGAKETCIISAPGRTELGGNHTDHNHGRVLAAAVDLDCLAAVTANEDRKITLVSEGFSSEISIDIDDLRPRPEERNRPEALVRGVVAACRDRGLAVGGFDACLHATCRPGTGLSSSAAFSVLIAAACSQLFHGNRLSPIELALIAQSAENTYFGKPCGLMDQLASAAGHILHIDFLEADKPEIEVIDRQSFSEDYCLAVVDTGGSHVGLTPEYAAIPAEMLGAAQVLGRSFARGLSLEDVWAGLPGMRETLGDRAILRLIHFIREDSRVEAMAQALRNGDTEAYLRLVRASGDSSWRLLQNCTSTTSTTQQGVALALVLTETFLADGAWRVQGGGFAGTIQVYIPRTRFEEYCTAMEGIFGSGCVIELHVGRPGVCALLSDGRLLEAGK